MSSYGGTPRVRRERKVSVLFRSAEGDKKHSSGVESVLFAQEQQALFSGSRDGSIRRWCVSSPMAKQEAIYEGHADWVNDMVLVNDLLISCSNDKTVRVWRGTSQAGTLLSTLTHHSDYVTCVAASASRNVVASAGLKGEIFVVDIKTGSIMHLYPTALGSSQVGLPAESAVGMSGGGQQQQQQQQHQPPAPVKGSLYSLAMQSTGGLLAAGSTDHAVRLWDLRTNAKVGKLRGHTDILRSLLIKDDGTQLLSGSSDSTIKLWDLGMQRCIQTYSVHSDSVWTLLASNDFSVVLSGGRDKAVYRTQLATRTAELLFTEQHPVRSVAMDNNTGSLWVAAASSSINKWSVPDLPSTAATTTFDRHSFVAGRTRPSMNSSPHAGRMHCASGRPKEPTVAAPTACILGISPIVHHKVMNNRHHILTRDADGVVALWDVLAGAMVETYGKVDFAAKDKDLFEPKAIPTWFTSDNRLGQLCITLDPASVFVAEEYAVMLGCRDLPDDHKVNFGKLMLDGAFAKWRRKAGMVHHSTSSSGSPMMSVSSSTADAEAAPVYPIPGMVLNDQQQLQPISASRQLSGALPGRAVAVAKGTGGKNGLATAPSIGLGEDDEELLPIGFWRLPPHQQPSIMCQLASGQQWLRPISHFTGAELEPDEVPTWVGDVVLRDAAFAPKEPKCAFVLMPAEGSNMPHLSQSKLNAPRILQVHKVANYCMVKLQEVNVIVELRPVYSRRPNHISAVEQPDVPGRMTLELLCNGMGVPYEMSLAAVKKYIWKKQDDLVFHFRVRDPAKAAPLPHIQPPS